MKWRDLQKRQKSRKASKNLDTAVALGLCSEASNAGQSIPVGHPEGQWVSEELTK
jgi:hypothetical protein